MKAALFMLGSIVILGGNFALGLFVPFDPLTAVFNNQLAILAAILCIAGYVVSYK